MRICLRQFGLGVSTLTIRVWERRERQALFLGYEAPAGGDERVNFESRLSEGTTCDPRNAPPFTEVTYYKPEDCTDPDDPVDCEVEEDTFYRELVGDTDPGQSHSLVVGSVCALEGVERSLSGLSPACRGLIGVCSRALNGVSGAPPRGWEWICRRSVAFGSGFCREAAFRDGVKSYVDVWQARASRHRRGATRSGRLRRGRGRSRR